jgi:EmrB/QacA subfamily drug resistance transporter
MPAPPLRGEPEVASSAEDGQGARLSDAGIRAVFVGLVLAMLLAALDQNIVAVALPRIGADLHGMDMLSWVVSSYLIGSTVSTPLFGKLGDLFGRRRALSSAILIFVLGAAGCALAPSMPFLVASRTLQGIGGGAVIAVAQAAIADVVAPRERGRYQIYFSGVHVVASVAGPVVGGLLTEHLSWHWIFWLNLPLGLLALLVSRRALSRVPVPRERAPIDYPGALLLSGALVVLLAGMTRIGMGVPPFAPLQLLAYGAAIVLLYAFVRQERRAPEPLVPLSLFAIPTVRLSCFILFVGYMQLIALSVLVPMRSQMLLGAAAGVAALGLVPLTFGGPAGAYLAGRIMLRTGSTRPLQVTGAGLVAIGVLALGLPCRMPAWAEPVLLGVIGIGIGLQFPTSLVAIQNAVPARHVGIATATAVFARSLGAAVGVAVLSTTLLLCLGGAGRSGAAMMRELVARAATDPATLAMATAAFDTTFIVSAAIAATSFVASFFLPESALRAD